MAVPSGEGTALVSVLEVLDGDEVMVVMAGGDVHRLRVDQIAPQGRRKKGRSLVKPSAGDRVVAVTQAYGGGEQKKESPEEGGPEEAGEEVPGQLDLLG